MSNKDHYFVIKLWRDPEGNTHFMLDEETEYARFPEGTVWNNETNEWESHDTKENFEENRDLWVNALSKLVQLKES